ncbi:MAG: ComEC/Rec2 family competence protein, partial [Acholeplasmataceae bacterium]
MKTFVRTLRSVDPYLYGIGVALFLLGILVPFTFFLFMLYLLVLWKRLNILWMVVLIAVLLVLHSLSEHHSQASFVRGEARVTSIERLTYSDRLTVRIANTYYHVMVPIGAYTVGDVVFVEADVEQYSEQSIPFGFDAQGYYRGQGIDGYLETETLELIGERLSFWQLRQTIKDRLIDHAYVRAYLLGEKAFANETDETFRSLGISFLLTMSGLHVYALLDGVRYVFFRLDLAKRVQEVLVALVLILFLYLQAGSMSMVRIALSYLLSWLNRRYDWRYTRLDRLFIVFYAMLLMKIDYLYHGGFILTFLILSAFSLAEPLYRSLGGYVQKLALSAIVFGVTLPFYLRVMPLVVLLMPVFIFLFTKPFFYGAILVTLIPEIAPFYDRAIALTEGLLRILEDRQVVIELPALGTLLTLLYYGFIWLLFLSHRLRQALMRLLLVVAVFGIALFERRYAYDYAVYFLDVKQGDSTVFVAPDCVLVIDSFQYTASFLNDLGIRTIDYLILTHADQDHVKEAPDIIRGFRVDHVLLSPYETYEVAHRNIERPRAKKSYSCGVLSFDILGPLQRYDNSNDNSLIIQVYAYGRS